MTDNTTHTIKIECSLVMGMPMSLAKCACGEKKAFYPIASKDAGYASDYAAAREWKCPHA